MSDAVTRGKELPIASPVVWRTIRRRAWQEQPDTSIRARTVLQPCCDYFRDGGADAVVVEHADGQSTTPPHTLAGGASASLLPGSYPVGCPIRHLHLSIPSHYPARTDEGGTENEGGRS